MAPFFPPITGTFKLEEPPALRRFTLGPVAMGVVAGVVVRLYRALTLSVGPTDSMLYFGAAFVLGQMLLLGMVTLHVGNYTLKRWLILVPVFTLAEVAAEVLTSLGLIALGIERMGSVPAVMNAWPAIALNTLLWRTATIVVYAGVLAGVVQLVRYLLLKRGHREHTLNALTHDDEE